MHLDNKLHYILTFCHYPFKFQVHSETAKESTIDELISRLQTDFKNKGIKFCKVKFSF